MSSHVHLHKKITSLRSKGLTYSEINSRLNTNIANSSLSYICRKITLSPDQQARIKEDGRKRLQKNRLLALEANRQIQAKRLGAYRKSNMHLITLLENKDVQLIALAMLYLGEGAKWKKHRGLMLGSADPKIILTYIGLLMSCYQIPLGRFRCRIQHRADQNSEELIEFWSNKISISKECFYPCYIDQRTIGQTTTKPDYHGVCTLSCSGTNIQLELQEIAVIISKAVGI